MLDFVRLGSEQAIAETGWVRRTACRLLGHRGVGFGVKLWALQRLLNRIGTERIRHVLDFGCGDGMYTFYLRKRLPKATIDAIDGDEAAVQQAERIVAAEGMRDMRFRTLRFEDFRPETPADLVVCLDAIYYSPEGLDHLERLCESVAPGGHLILSSAYVKRYYGESFQYYVGWVDVDTLDPLFSPRSTGEVMQRCGLEIVERDDYPSAFATWIIEQQRSGKPYVMLLYPLFVFLTWLGRRGSATSGTRYMYLARRPEADEMAAAA